MTRALITDLDGVFLDCNQAAKDLGFYEEYALYRSNPEEILKFELDELGSKYKEFARYLAENAEIYPKTLETFQVFRENGYKIDICTDNLVYSIEENQEILKGELIDENGETYVNKIFARMYFDTSGGKVRIKFNGNKKDFIYRKFENVEMGILVVDDKNDLDAAAMGRKLADEEHKVFVAKVNEKHYNLFKPYADAFVDKFSDLPNNKKLIEMGFLKNIKHFNRPLTITER